MYLIIMKTLPIGELKYHFSEILNEVRDGEEVVITYGRKKENIAVIVPYEKYKKRNRINLGKFEDEELIIHDDFEMTEEELLGL